MYPRQSPTTHTEQLGDEASVYDWARAQVHALNPTAAHVWRQCEGATSPKRCGWIDGRTSPEAEAVVELTLRELARPTCWQRRSSPADRSAMDRRWLLGRGVAAAMLPAIYRSWPRRPWPLNRGRGRRHSRRYSPEQGTQGPTITVTLTDEFCRRRHDGGRRGEGVTVSNVSWAA